MEEEASDRQEFVQRLEEKECIIKQQSAEIAKLRMENSELSNKLRQREKRIVDLETLVRTATLLMYAHSSYVCMQEAQKPRKKNIRKQRKRQEDDG